MPKRRRDPATEVLAYFTDTTYEVAEVVLALVKTTMAKRAPVVEKVTRRKRTPKVDQPSAAQRAMDAIVPTAPVPVPLVVPATQKARQRRMTATSTKPANEATPIVPLQDEVGDDAYTGD